MGVLHGNRDRVEPPGPNLTKSRNPLADPIAVLGQGVQLLQGPGVPVAYMGPPGQTRWSAVGGSGSAPAGAACNFPLLPGLFQWPY